MESTTTSVVGCSEVFLHCSLNVNWSLKVGAASKLIDLLKEQWYLYVAEVFPSGMKVRTASTACNLYSRGCFCDHLLSKKK